MSDIVERLHDSPCAECAEYQNAVREIERLRALIKLILGRHLDDAMTSSAMEYARRALEGK